MGGAKRKWANASFLASRLTEFNTGFDFITGSCGGHAFSFGLGTTLRRCEELSIKPHYSSAKFEAAALPASDNLPRERKYRAAPPTPTPPKGERLDLHRRRQERRGLDLRPKAPARH